MATPAALRRMAVASRAARGAIAPRVVPMTARRFKSGPFGYQQAKALVYSENGDPDKVLSLHTHTISPGLPEASILLKALATPINPADINTVQGVYPAKPKMTQLLGTADPSAVAGNEGCFEIAALGPHAPPGLQVGDWVVMKHTAQGTWRTHFVVDGHDVLKIPNKDGLTPIQVGTVSVNPCTAYRMLKDFVDLQPGDWVVQNGANSGVGRAAIQLAREWGIKTVNVIRDRPSHEETLAMKQELLDLGATFVITQDELMDKGFLKEFAQRLADRAGGVQNPAKLALNCVGGRPTLQLCRLMAPGSHMVTYGAMSKQPLAVGAGMLIFQDLKFSGFWLSRWSDRNPEEKLRTIDAILDLTRQGKFKDIPVETVRWEWDTPQDTLLAAVSGTLEGFRAGKGVFVYGET